MKRSKIDLKDISEPIFFYAIWVHRHLGTIQTWYVFNRIGENKWTEIGYFTNSVHLKFSLKTNWVHHYLGTSTTRYNSNLVRLQWHSRKQVVWNRVGYIAIWVHRQLGTLQTRYISYDFWEHRVEWKLGNI